MSHSLMPSWLKMVCLVLSKAWRLRCFGTLPDLFSTRHHTTDFGSTRAELIHTRLYAIALLFAVFAPLWIPVDYLSLNAAEFDAVLLMRVGWVAALLALTIGWRGSLFSLNGARLRLSLVIVTIGLAYLYTWGFALELDSQNVMKSGYTFMPYVAVAMLAIFPLTFLESFFFATLTAVLMLMTAALTGNLLELELWTRLWFTGVLSALAIWANGAQLHGLMRLYREATRDPLTGLYNRRLILREMEHLMESTPQHDANLSILLMDLDKFKRVNDEYGHLNGDAVLRDFAEVLMSIDPARLHVGRYGGEEFLIVAAGLDIDAAVALGNTINTRARARIVQGIEPGQQLTYTTSVGVAKMRAGEDIKSVIDRADQALYEAKSTGRDRTVAAPA